MPEGSELVEQVVGTWNRAFDSLVTTFTSIDKQMNELKEKVYGNEE